MIIKYIFTKLKITFFKRNKDIIRYWKNKGAEIGEQCEFYPSATLGSEPFLVHRIIIN